MPRLTAAVEALGGWFKIEPHRLSDERRPVELRPLLIPLNGDSNLNTALKTRWRWRWLRTNTSDASHWGQTIYAVPPEVNFLRQYEWPELRPIRAQHSERADAAYKALRKAQDAAHPEIDAVWATEPFDDDRYNALVEEREAQLIPLRNAWRWHLKQADQASTASSSWNVFRNVVEPSTSATLALACVDSKADRQILAVNDSELCDVGSRRIRRWICQSRIDLDKALASEDNGLHEAPEWLKDSGPTQPEDEMDYAGREPWEQRLVSHLTSPPWSDVPDRVIATECPYEANATLPPLASVAWCWEPDELIHSWPIRLRPMYAYHRVLSGQASHDACTTAGMTHLQAIANGQAPRGEDDLTLLRLEVVAAEGRHWSATDAGPLQKWLWPSGVAANYPLKSVADVCTQIDLLSSPEFDQLRADDVVVPLRGKRAGQARIIDTIRQDSRTSQGRCDAQMMIRSAEDAATEAELLRLRCEDPEFLVRQMVEHRDRLIAYAFGSLLDPIVPQHLVRSLKVFWPSGAERESLLGPILNLADKTDFLNDVDGREGVYGNLRSLKLKMGKLARIRDAEELEEPLSPFALQAIWNSIRKEFDLIGQALAEAAGTAWLEPKSIEPPLTIGFHRRRSLSEPKADEVKLTLERAELCLHHHALLGLALLEQADQNEVANIISKEWSDQDRFSLAFNAKKQVSIRALKALRNDDISPALPSHLVPLRDLYIQPRPSDVVAEVEEIIQARNRLSHGYIGFESDRMADHIALQQREQSLFKLINVISIASMVLVEGRSQRRNITSLRLRHLIGANEVTEVTEEEVGVAANNTANDGEVHARTGAGSSLLSLDPWIIYRPGPNGGNATPWLFDGWKKNIPFYKSPLRPGQTLDAPDLQQRLTEVRRGGRNA